MRVLISFTTKQCVTPITHKVAIKNAVADLILAKACLIRVSVID